MKPHSLIIKSFITAILMVSTSIQAGEVKSVNPNNAKTTDNAKECGIDLLPPPKPISLDGVSYISGGICISGVEQMKTLAKDYPLEVVLVEKTDEYEKENYIADVKIRISDIKNNVLLDVSTEGPYLLVDLPKGKYLISAEYNNVLKEKRTTVGSKHQRIVFLWAKNQ